MKHTDEQRNWVEGEREDCHRDQGIREENDRDLQDTQVTLFWSQFSSLCLLPSSVLHPLFLLLHECRSNLSWNLSAKISPAKKTSCLAPVEMIVVVGEREGERNSPDTVRHDSGVRCVWDITPGISDPHLLPRLSLSLAISSWDHVTFRSSGWSMKKMQLRMLRLGRHGSLPWLLFLFSFFVASSFFFLPAASSFLPSCLVGSEHPMNQKNEQEWKEGIGVKYTCICLKKKHQQPLGYRWWACLFWRKQQTCIHGFGILSAFSLFFSLSLAHRGPLVLPLSKFVLLLLLWSHVPSDRWFAFNARHHHHLSDIQARGKSFSWYQIWYSVSASYFLFLVQGEERNCYRRECNDHLSLAIRVTLPRLSLPMIQFRGVDQRIMIMMMMSCRGRRRRNEQAMKETGADQSVCTQASCLSPLYFHAFFFFATLKLG